MTSTDTTRTEQIDTDTTSTGQIDTGRTSTEQRRTGTGPIPVDAFTRRVLNPFVGRLTRWGISLRGTRVLEVRGRVSGTPRHTVVNLLDHDGARYLVAPRGDTDWVRNLRAAGTGSLRVGRRVEHVAATEVTGPDVVPVLRAYLERWAWEVGRFFDGLDATSSDAELDAAAHRFPVFRLTTSSEHRG